MILTALNSYYERLARKGEVLPQGFSKQKISYAIVLSSDGKPVDVLDVRDTSGKKPSPRLLTVPQPPKRTAGINACLFWDKTSYVLGVTAKEDEKAQKRLLSEHATFKEKMLTVTTDTKDEGLVALRKFLQKWQPESFAQSPFDNNEDILDTNVIFRLDDGTRQYLHDRPAARELWLAQEKDEGSIGRCLVTGLKKPIARLHPSIKGVKGAQSSGANIISFNNDAFISFDKKQSYNAPVSEKVADQYTKALNYLLRRENNRSLCIGDATIVFWALAADDDTADQAEIFLRGLLSTDEQEANELKRFLDTVGKGRPLKNFRPDLDPSTHTFVLGISPNVARLSIRFWQTGTLDFFVRKIAQHYCDLELEPLPWKTPPSIWRLLIKTAPSRSGKHDSKDVLPHLAGEVMRAILTGGNYPHSLLTSIVMRLRTDGDISGLRVALCKAVIMRRMRINYNKGEAIVSLDEENKNVGYQLGRLFAELENAQDNAIEGANTTISDQYYGSASASPATTFPTLFRKYRHHASKLRKEKNKKGAHIAIEKKVGEIIDKLPAEFPKILNIEDQGRFAIGYYHQRSLRFQKKTNN